MKRLVFITMMIGLFMACALRVEAHAFLDHAEPKVGSAIKGPPAAVKIWFTEPLEGTFSKIEVFDAKGQEVDKRDSVIDPADKSLMCVSVPVLTAGSYTVKWNAVSVDTHHTNGTFSFIVTAK